MDRISYFKLQAKNLLRDFKTQKQGLDTIYTYSPKFFADIDELVVAFDIDEERFTLMNAQHIIAYLAGFRNWSDLLHATDAALELGELLLNNRDQYYVPLIEEWKMYLEHGDLQDMCDEFKLELFKKAFLTRS